MKNIAKKAMLGLAVAGAATPALAGNKEKMNIILMFVDDLGWADQGFRNPKFDTPNIDKLHSESMSFDRAYVGQPASSASRACLLTGKEPIRTGVVRHINNEDSGTGKKYNMWPGDPTMMPSYTYMRLEEITYAERMREMGYYNMFVGKWHLGEEEYWPKNQGFDETWAENDYGNVSSYFAPFFKGRNFKGGDLTLTQAKEGEFMTDYLTDKCVDMISSYDKAQPFMLSLSYFNVHTPNVGRPELVEKYKKRGMSDIDANYAAQVEVVDISVGQIRKALEDKGIADNTVIVYFSDQGGYFTNYPLRGRKDIEDTFAEGGIRVPLLIHYPGVTKAGSSTEIPVQAIDLYPTFLEIASGKKCTDKQIQGVSLMPILKGGTIKDRNLYFFRPYHKQYAAMINGDWKIIKYMIDEKTNRFEMYNLVSDMSETTDVQNFNVARFEKMKKDLKAWEDEVVPIYRTLVPEYTDKEDYRNRYKY